MGDSGVWASVPAGEEIEVAGFRWIHRDVAHYIFRCEAAISSCILERRKETDHQGSLSLQPTPVYTVQYSVYYLPINPREEVRKYIYLGSKYKAQPTETKSEL